MKHARNVIRIVGTAIFLALMFFNVDVMGPRGAQATATSSVVKCDLCQGNQQECAVYCFPDEDGDYEDCHTENSNEDPIVIEE